MLGAVGELSGRTPMSDAPPLDPSLWEGKDCAFITLLCDQLNAQQRLEQNSQEELLEKGAAAPRRAMSSNASHTQSLSRPTTWWGKMLRYLFPRYYAQKSLMGLGFAQLSRDELVMRMQYALQAGDTELSALIAHELARRRARLYDHAENISSADGTSGDAKQKADSWSFTSSLDHSAHPAAAATSSSGMSGVSPHVHDYRSSSTAAVDSSFAVPDVLLNRRRSVDRGPSVRF